MVRPFIADPIAFFEYMNLHVGLEKVKISYFLEFHFYVGGEEFKS